VALKDKVHLRKRRIASARAAHILHYQRKQLLVSSKYLLNMSPVFLFSFLLLFSFFITKVPVVPLAAKNMDQSQPQQCVNPPHTCPSSSHSYFLQESVSGGPAASKEETISNPTLRKLLALVRHTCNVLHLAESEYSSLEAWRKLSTQDVR
jgi:hypothetical protein